MTFQAITTADLSKVDVVLWFDDKYELFDAYLLFDGYYMVFIDDEAVIATLEPSRQLAGKFEIFYEVLAFQASEDVENLISFAEQMTAVDLIRLVDLYGVKD